MTVYFTTVGGDVNLKPHPGDAKKTIMAASKELLESEKAALEAMLKKFKVDPTRPLEGSEHVLPVPLDKACAALRKALKARGETISAVKLSDGRIEEIRFSDIGKVAGRKPEPKAAAVFDRLPKSCPAPVYTPRDVRASAVLDEFLNPLQRADFERCGAFTAVGCDSGHHYMITHRHSPVLRDGGMKTLLRDLTDGGDVCSRDIGLPPSEECLALLLMVTLREDYWLHAESRPWRSLDDLKDAVGVALGVYQERGGLPTVRVEWTEPGGQRTKRTFVVRDGHWETARPKTKGK